MTPEGTTSRKWIYIKAALFVTLMIGAGFCLVVFFFGGIITALLTGDFNLFIGGLFFFILFLLAGGMARKLEPAWREFEDIRGIRPKTTREAFKENLPFFGAIIFVLIFGFVFETYFLSFAPTISPSLAKDMLTSILTLDGILIGFYGVVLAQFLWAIHSKGNVIYEQMITHREDKDTIQKLNDEVERLGRIKLITIGTFFYSMMPLLASILLCLNKLPLTDGYEPISPRTLMFDPILALIVGIILLAITTLQTNLFPKTETKGLTEEQK